MSVLKAFNNHFMEFVDDVQSIFPENNDIKKAKNGIEMLRKANPRMIIMIWKEHITTPYQAQIEAGDISFFIDKDYTRDVSQADNARSIMEAVDRLRGPIREMGTENQSKAMKYIQNLTKLSMMY